MNAHGHIKVYSQISNLKRETGVTSSDKRLFDPLFAWPSLHPSLVLRPSWSVGQPYREAERRVVCDLGAVLRSTWIYVKIQFRGREVGHRAVDLVDTQQPTTTYLA